ncbi:Glycosyl transferase family 2 [Pseudomonas delhiensis]|uniref:Glycosyl transferase family 2 n=2 Tax=Pseudomonas delhiensis TaxID=366289 RepID=A0A239MRC6_9PSED|nr:Glycosyl transferase family 2 [Pseudomonas delhiensis]SNT44399.1 Glycosyl transferase family 2 [Pseudomonas delhiensis]
MSRSCVVMTFHRERTLGQWSLFGFERMRSHAELFGHEVQLLAVLDHADPFTLRMVREHPVLRPTDRVIEASLGDPGLARNLGVSEADGELIGILDGDDYCSANWITEASSALAAQSGEVVVHTDYLLTFGESWEFSRQSDQLTGKGGAETCFKHHLWASTVFASRELFLRCPYREANMARTGFGYEDWDWSLATLAAGARHTTAPQTALFYRRKPAGSRQSAGLRQQVVVRPGPFFADGFWR